MFFNPFSEKKQVVEQRLFKDKLMFGVVKPMSQVEYSENSIVFKNYCKESLQEKIGVSGDFLEQFATLFGQVIFDSGLEIKNYRVDCNKYTGSLNYPNIEIIFESQEDMEAVVKGLGL